jgi:hypothetical protein
VPAVPLWLFLVHPEGVLEELTRARPERAVIAALQAPFGARHAVRNAGRPLNLSGSTGDLSGMLTRRTMLLGAACSVLAIPAAAAADPGATAFVQAIYAAYKGKNAKGITLDKDAAIRRYFEPSLAALMIKDIKDAARKGDVPELDGDPFIDAQDWDIANFDIAVTDTVAGKASATVKFVNLGKPVTAVLDLVKVGNDWRIHDITWQRDGKPDTLRALYAH